MCIRDRAARKSSLGEICILHHPVDPSSGGLHAVEGNQQFIGVLLPLTTLKQDGCVMRNEDEILEILAVHYYAVITSNINREDFIMQKDEAEQDLFRKG